MFRILLADDEGIMLESIAHILRKNFGSECEIACVKTGRAVIEQAKDFRPDIAFLDIHMPGLNGIQAIKEVLKFNSSIVFIIISAYDKFAYAQEAINLGVLEFITKPVNKKRILDVCLKAMRQVELARKKLSDDLIIREKLEIVLPMLESGFIYNALWEDSDGSKNEYADMLNLNKPYGLMTVLEFGDSFEGGVMTNAVGVGVRINKNYAVIREIVKDFFDCIIGSIMGNRLVIFVAFDREMAGYEERVGLITRARNMIIKIEGRVDLKCRAGIGSVKIMSNARESYKEALKALRESDSRVMHIMDIPIADYDGEYPLDLENGYFNRGVKGDREGAASYANEFFDWMLQNDGGVRANIEVKVLELVMRLERCAFEAGSLRYGFCYRQNYLNELSLAKDMGGLRRWFLDRTKEVCETIATAGEKAYENVVLRAKTYIDENFAKELSLDDVSEMVNISPYYFSKLFKQEVGETFIEYVTRTRIKNARRLLEDPRYSIKEVCVMSGYGDPNYFSRIFKKYEGMTPSEYRERLK